MRHLSSNRMADFAAFYDDDVELVSVARPGSASLTAGCDESVAACPRVQARWEQDVGDRNEPSRALARSLDADQRAPLTEAIALASEVLGDLLGCEQVGVRASTLRQPMCPRFHVDRVPCRMLITMSGPGTEWIANDDVDWERFADRGTNAPPLRPGAGIRQLATASWSLLKGGTWGGGYGGVVHRSPHREGERLLLTLDPIFDSRSKA